MVNKEMRIFKKYTTILMLLLIFAQLQIWLDIVTISFEVQSTLDV